MKNTLTLVFVLILMAMTYYTVKASLDRSVLAAGDLLPDPWFQATLCDAYCGFLTFYCWVAYKESSWLGRIGWFSGDHALRQLRDGDLRIASALAAATRG